MQSSSPSFDLETSIKQLFQVRTTRQLILQNICTEYLSFSKLKISCECFAPQNQARNHNAEEWLPMVHVLDFEMESSSNISNIYRTSEASIYIEFEIDFPMFTPSVPLLLSMVRPSSSYSQAEMNLETDVGSILFHVLSDFISKEWELSLPADVWSEIVGFSPKYFWTHGDCDFLVKDVNDIFNTIPVGFRSTHSVWKEGVFIEHASPNKPMRCAVRMETDDDFEGVYIPTDIRPLPISSCMVWLEQDEEEDEEEEQQDQEEVEAELEDPEQPFAQPYYPFPCRWYHQQTNPGQWVAPWTMMLEASE